MAVIHSITIENFKGIGRVTIEFNKESFPPVHTLIGLNESGKTTILEGLSHFVTGDNAVSSLFDGVHSKSGIDSLIPVNKKAAFTGEIKISANINTTEADYEMVARIAKDYDLEIDKFKFIGESSVSRIYKFVDSAHDSTTNIWTYTLHTRKIPKGRGKPGPYKPYVRPKDQSLDLWRQITSALQKTLPRIAYFPTFLVDMPKKIYLAPHDNETAVNRYYRLVFQDILDSLNEGLVLDKHVVARIETFKANDSSTNWLSALFGGVNRSPIDSVFTKISNAVTREVLGSWQRVFQRKISAKNILVEWSIDAENDDLPYATFSIFDGESRYYISERSLGFRWFFSFLLFTAFKHRAKNSTLFVFDEPAANLHAKAQAELLKSFSRTVADGDGIVYSTHSHHMINPQWVSGAYIVENTALDYDSDDDTFGLNAKPTNIVATPYRHFVAQHPTRTSYFQPVIDMLEYVTPAVIGEPPFVLVEGIMDFYALSIARRNSGKKYKFAIMPGVGAGASGPQISLLLGRGDSFVMMLDDDAAGRKAVARYQQEWYLDSDQVFTVGALDAEFTNARLEELLSSETQDLIRTHAGLSTKPNKKQIGLYLAEKYAEQSDKEAFCVETQARLQKILDSLAARLKTR